MRERGLKLVSIVKFRRPSPVAPRAGAWIETPQMTPEGGEIESLPVRERGLKLERRGIDPGVSGSLPVRERGLKLWKAPVLAMGPSSLPVRERGLKHHRPRCASECHGSLPVRERGLKLNAKDVLVGTGRSLPVRERGLKRLRVCRLDLREGRSPCGSVD